MNTNRISEGFSASEVMNALSTQRFSGLTFLLLFMVAAFAWPAAASAATLTTDKPDYQPGDYVTFTGTGWQPGEVVTIDIYETSVDPIFLAGTVSPIADGNGNISN